MRGYLYKSTMTDSVNTKDNTDIKKILWVEKITPKLLHPYIYLMRLDRPIGIWLLLIPGLWSLALASNGISHFNITTYYYITLFTIGSILMRGAGCIINDLWDRDLDKLVKRTKNRPIANGAISIKSAILFLATLLLTSLAILLQFNWLTIFLGLLVMPLIISYPLMKRITWWPQAFLGLTFNFSALMGWSAITGEITIPAFLLYIGGIFWTLGYDTIYAHQDKEDDAMAGIKSTALKFGNHSKLWVSIFYGLSITSIFCATFITKGLDPVSLLIIAPALHFTWQIKTWEPDNQSSSLSIFKSNKATGLLILLSLL